MSKTAWITGLIAIVSFTGCNGGNSTSDPAEAPSTFAGEYPIEIVATVGMVADIVREVGGDHVQVTQLMGSQIDPHTHNATRDDVQKLMRADMIFYNGLHLEGKMTDTLTKLSKRQRIVAVADRLDKSDLLTPNGAQGQSDPHVWMNVSLWSKAVDVVATALIEFDPNHKDDYQANAKNYQTQLASLHEYGLKVIATIPEQSRILITSHDAFNYFGRAYNLQVEGVQGLSTESEAGLRRVNELVKLIVDRQIPAVFVESSVSPKNIEALIEGAQSKGHEVRIGGELFSDAMGEAGTYEGTYIGMLDANLTRIARALGGEAAPRGMQDRLQVETQNTP
ncbi:metal ABC transporter solute-binding protein, Zn/Mn family [Thalassoroseus pseudoceratinae]|uniref:metal ABC transporter solute-binding protein, Zn/Mn family n=1 Tax=Thalassoroseus pseudoceratinae TaxID=2713176 RepID=UPI001F10BAAF|nr:zinc ABC transporter substrate-binding protein [Thalassoroseus pseudoceratinae]